jgi:capsular exopolysaccharide synthesis family protein
MSRFFSAFRKASQVDSGAPPRNGEMTDHRLGAPALAGDSRDTRRRTRRRTKKRRAGGGLDERLVACHGANPLAVEQYRKLYVDIVRAGRVRELRTLLIVSALENEGKTTTALNLAITMAASGGEEVLLVETDFRQPRVRHMLGTHPECGLADYIRGGVEYAQIFSDTPIPGLTVVHAGKRLKNPTALLRAEKMGQFFQAVKSQMPYHHIVLDAPPLLLTSDPVAVMQHVDTALLVVQAKKTPRDMVAKAIDILGEEHLLGCVFNGITASDAYSYRYYYHSDYYHPNGNTPHQSRD